MYTAGIDIGGTNTRIAIVNEAYEIMQRVQFSTETDNPNATLKKFRRSYRALESMLTGLAYPVRGRWI